MKRRIRFFQCLEVTDLKMVVMRILSIIIFGLFCVGCVSSQQPSETLADRAYARSVELLSAGQQSAAEDLIEQALESSPDDINLLFAKGVLDRSRWSKHEAMYYFAQLIHGMPGTVSARAASISLILDEGINAENNLDSLIQLSDENPDNLYLLWLSAIQCREQKKGALGKMQYEKLLSHFDVGPVLLHQSYANILSEQLKEYDEALKHRRLAVLMEPRGWSYQGLANTLRDMGNYEESCEAWEKCLEIDPDCAKYWFQWGCVLFNFGQYEQALEKFKQAIRLNPENSWCFQYMARCNKRLGNYAEMAEQLRNVIEMGSNQFAVMLASSLEGGLDLDENIEKVMEALDGAAALERTYSLVSLAKQYATGTGVARDYPKSARLYREAAEMGSSTAAMILGDYYFGGIGVEKDEKKGARWYTQAADAEHAGAQLRLGDCYWRGRGVERDLLKAVRCYQASAEQEHIPALMRLADFYENETGVEQSREKADECYRKALKINPKYKPARLKLEHSGPRVSSSTDLETLIKAAESGDATAQRLLGFRYRWGQGLPQDNQLAVKWYQAAADQDDVDALWRLARCYANGYGTEVDEKAAFDCYVRAQKIKPDGQSICFSFGLFLATCEDIDLRDPERGLVLAKKALAIREDVPSLNILSQVYAANERYQEAVQTAGRLVEYWKKSNPDRNVPPIFLERLKEFENKAIEAAQ